MTAPARIGERPTMREDLDRALALIAALTERIAVIEAARDVDEQLDGAAPAALPPSCVPIKAAARTVGYSESGLRKCIDRAKITGERPWWHYRRGRLLIDLDHCPRVVRT
jgi:hypothetical protein